MFCYHCNTDIGNNEVCPVCGADLKYVQKAGRLANAYYNDGLEKAKVRNLSGAAISLRKSLKFYKYHTEARNLLGLVLFEMGETVAALSEWVISKNYQKEDNDASRYLDEIQNDPAMLDSINQTIKKYNQALAYCKSDSRDLATIQLKKVLSINPNFVKAHQLLALLYIQDEKYDLAKKTLRNAAKIDTDNTISLRYMKEVNARLKERNPNKKPKNDDLISYTNGNETIIMPKRFKETSIGATVAAIVIGLVVGIAVTSFLVIPQMRSKYVQEAKSSLVEANDNLTSRNQTITSLEEEIASLEEKLATEQGTSEQVATQITEYDKLLGAFGQYTANDWFGCATSLISIEKEKLSESGQATYDVLYNQTMETYLSTYYGNGYNAFYTGDYAAAAENLLQVCDINMAYSDGNAAYLLAQAYTNLGDNESAIGYYQFIIDNYPNTNRAQTAQTYVTAQ